MRGQGAAFCTCVPLSELVRPEGGEDELQPFIEALSTNELELDDVSVSEARLIVSWLVRDFLCVSCQLWPVLSMFGKVFLHSFLQLNLFGRLCFRVLFVLLSVFFLRPSFCFAFPHICHLCHLLVAPALYALRFGFLQRNTLRRHLC